MKPELQSLEITKGELKHLNESQEAWAVLVLFATLFFCFFIVIYSLMMTIIYAKYIFFYIFLWFILLVILLVILMELIRQRKQSSSLKKEVEKHNQIIANIHTLDQLAEVGNPIKLEDREQVIEALKINRENLVRALKTQKILRDNPKFKPEYFAIDLTNLRSLEVSETANEYGKLLSEALQVGTNVQKEMRRLQKRR